MPSRHVRFAPTSTVHTFSPSSALSKPPRLTYDNYSPPSSNSLLTPPDAPIALPPPKHHLPKRSHTVHHHTSSVHLHRLLQDSSHPDLLFDVRLSPTSAKASRHSITPDELNEPATTPRLPSMIIFSPYLSWSIRVAPSGYSRSRDMHYVTVWDVLSAVHMTLRKSVNQAEYDALGRGSSYENRVRKAYHDRYSMYPRHSPAYEEEKMGGVKRIDYLAEHVRFMGMVPRDMKSGEFTLRTGS
ncbi:hypothetical protein Agabi119p4_8229 [Agaricus bisporus var. burnettii]|uniref:DUF6699 domain-containing protein n=1 Tax=Agaricus bisporus var. burnettii TaxID=192524 RepID=A0A8H7EY66_AGABI|nr:hypothetical protein Agabi119p4_8229 [Agaricus bisporus var. burnettii]